ncbi:MAG: DNA-processing protein DprA, partial [Planctomycetaceae bacterium]|nr:DNA-processing protein DprA [Planctomycetaceae bacterium]
AVISESPLHRKPSRGLFPQRNRIVSGMSLGVIVIEASETSGTLHTARHAMEQGRDVFALPGPLDSRESEGCHRLIRDGVTLVRGVDDVLQGLGPLMQPVSVPATQERTRKETVTEERPSSQNSIEPAERAIRIPRELNLTEQQTQILQCVNQEPTLIDDVIEKSGLEASRVLATITVLQMKKIVERLPGNRIALSNHIG